MSASLESVARRNTRRTTQLCSSRKPSTGANYDSVEVVCRNETSPPKPTMALDTSPSKQNMAVEADHLPALSHESHRTVPSVKKHHGIPDFQHCKHKYNLRSEPRMNRAPKLLLGDKENEMGSDCFADGEESNSEEPATVSFDSKQAFRSKSIESFISLQDSDSELDVSNFEPASSRRPRSQTPKSRSVTPAAKDKTKRKFSQRDEDASRSASGTRKRALRGKTPIHDTGITIGRVSQSREATPTAVSTTFNSLPDMFDGMGSSAKRSTNVSPMMRRSSSRKSSTFTMLKPIPVRPPICTISSNSNSDSVDVFESTGEPHLLMIQEMTPKAGNRSKHSAFSLTAGVKVSEQKPVFVGDDMDVFFNTPPVKMSTKKMPYRSTSPTPGSRIRHCNNEIASDSESASDAICSSYERQHGFEMPTKKNRVTNRVLFPAGKLDHVDQISRKMKASVLDSPVANRAPLTLYGREMRDGVGRRSRFHAFDGDDEFETDEGTLMTDDTADESDYVRSHVDTSASMCHTHAALILVFRHLYTHFNGAGQVFNALFVCKKWKDAAHQVLWEAPVFYSLSAMLKMQCILWGTGYQRKLSFGPGATANSEKNGLRRMLGMIDPSTPRKLLFTDASRFASTSTLEPKKPALRLELARLVKSISFHLFYPSDKCFPPTFDVQAFVLDSFPNLIALCLSGRPEWINPFFLNRMITSSRFSQRLKSLELLSGAMDKLIGDSLLRDSIVLRFRKFKGLTRLVISESSALDDVIMRVLAESNSGLEVLSLTACSNVTDVGISQVVERCPNLESLNISYCGRAGNGFLIAFGNTGRKSQLTSLTLAQGTNPILNENALLQILVPTSADSNPPCANLRFLHLTCFPTLTVEGVASIIKTQTRLTEFQLRGCPQISKTGILKGYSALSI